MDILAILTAKPILIGLHLGFAILGIDAFLWLLGELAANAGSVRRRAIAAAAGFVGYFLTWIIGGYYYVRFYGPLVKPVIKAGSAPWAHAMLSEEIFIVEDTLEDERFKDNPMVTKKPHIRFYAGISLHSPNHLAIGVLCIKDTKPRKLSAKDAGELISFGLRAENELNRIT